MLTNYPALPASIQMAQLHLPKATHSFNCRILACQRPQTVSISIALLVKRHISFQPTRPCLPNATDYFKWRDPTCQTPQILSIVTALCAKSHGLLQKKCQKPHSVSKDLTFAQVDFLSVKQSVAFGEKSEVERGFWHPG